MYITSLSLRINLFRSAIVMVSNNLPSNLPFHSFFLLLSWLNDFCLLSIYGLSGVVRWCPIPLNNIYILVPFWWHLKYLCHSFFIIEFALLARQRRITPILGSHLIWLLSFLPLFHYYILHVNISQRWLVLKSNHLANLVSFQLAQ